ncbi:MAG: class II SORL domain-containing protein [Candidatus Omnitrophota bacterium]
MPDFKDLFQNADWKKEKHVPVIECVEKAKKGQAIVVSISVGKEIPHPHTTAHHIRWIGLYFQPEGEKFPCQLAHFELSAHGESGQGADTSSVYTNPEVTVRFKTEKPGMLFASSYCNIHGLWQSAMAVMIE